MTGVLPQRAPLMPARGHPRRAAGARLYPEGRFVKRRVPGITFSAASRDLYGLTRSFACRTAWHRPASANCCITFQFAAKRWGPDLPNFGLET